MIRRLDERLDEKKHKKEFSEGCKSIEEQI
jgi:hypothetical protein